TFDASRVARTSNETRPHNLAVMWCIKAWSAPINQGNIDVSALVPLAAQSTETSRGTVTFATAEQVMARNSERAVSAQRFADMSFGINQTWQNVLAMRSAGVGYVNSTGKPILVSVVSSTADRGLQIRVDNVIVSKQGQDGGT
ncbi:phage tail protein, partial [Pseudomonas sp. MWU12-2534b]